MTMRGLAAGSLVLTLALCFGRVAAWAALLDSAADAHACCPAPDAPETPGITRCCPDAAAVAAPAVHRLDALVSVSTPEADEPSTRLAGAPEVPAPPGPQARLSTLPSRAPPAG
jgi:hypothetical protein